MSILPENAFRFNRLSRLLQVFRLRLRVCADDDGFMIKQSTLFGVLALVPLTVFATAVTPGDFYDDVRPDSPEAVGINLLTRAGVVQGYGDHIFGPNRLVNRAEFLKFAMLSAPTTSRPLLADTGGCFPDVPPDAWFGPYVCGAKNAGIVKGNPDGLFHPERTVQYDEALKMLTLLFGYQVEPSTASDWGKPYEDAAVERGTALTIHIALGTPLTRAVTARLTGAFLAESEGNLNAFREAETGTYASSSSSISSSSSVASSAASSASSSTAPLFTLPPVSHFLVTGQVTDAIADGVIRSNGETAKVSLAEVKLFSEVRSIDRLEILTDDGQLVTTLTRKTTTDTLDYKQTFQSLINPEDRFQIAADTDVHLVIRAIIRSDTNAGFSDELLQVRSISLTLLGDTSNQTTSVPLSGPFPKHQTSFGRILNVTRMSPDTAPLTASSSLILGSYAFTGTVVSGRTLALSALTFSVRQSGTVALSNLTLWNRRTGAFSSCTLNTVAMTISCTSLSSSVGIFPSSDPLVLDLRGDVALPAGKANTAFEVYLDAAGSPEALGSIEWTDFSGNFRWIERATDPVSTGTQYQ